ncbi:hypothetical protein [Streptomyces sp. NBC_00028]|uniref:hypothetical protein n=1 Tax=Streptomyces sp. NBC_00028 TaxID=2975624 RepID=UPI003866430A
MLPTVRPPPPAASAAPRRRGSSRCVLLVYGVSTWLPELTRASGYSLSSSITFLMVINAGGIVGMLIAGRTADKFGPVKVSAIWCPGDGVRRHRPDLRAR